MASAEPLVLAVPSHYQVKRRREWLRVSVLEMLLLQLVAFLPRPARERLCRFARVDVDELAIPSSANNAAVANGAAGAFSADPFALVTAAGKEAHWRSSSSKKNHSCG